MSAVVQFPISDTPPTPPHLRRLRLGSWALSWLFTGLIRVVGLVASILIAVVVFYGGENYRIGAGAVWIGEGSPDSVAFHTLTLPHRLVYAAVGVARIAPALMIFWHLRGAFGLPARGEVFGRRNGQRLAHIGAWLCLYAVSPFVCHLVLSAPRYA